nr:ornithine cyclodeaminase family protein [uncultured Shinella sp.]
MTQVVQIDAIREALEGLDAIAEMRSAFQLYSAGKVVVPPVGELLFDEPPGEMHVKYGAIRADDCFVIKVATGFYRNPALGLPSSNGLVLVFSAKTGHPLAILFDEGHLTDVRTAAAGAAAAGLIMPPDLEAIGICGSGTQARLQAAYLREVSDCRRLIVWARDGRKARSCADDIARLGFETAVAENPKDLMTRARLIVTTTASREPYLMAGDIQPGTRIIAVGADTAEKSEVDVGIIERAAFVLADSRLQSQERGEIHHALARGRLDKGRIIELGEILAEPGLLSLQRDDICVVDLTGVAVQDIQIAKAVCRRLGI